MNASDMVLSVVIPAYNEAKRLPVAFAEIEKLTAGNFFKKLEIIFVDDGSTDTTAEVIHKYINSRHGLNASCKIISYCPNCGKGQAIKSGMLAAQGDYILMADADMSTPLTDIAKFVPAIENDTPIVIGTRKAKGSVLIKRQPWHREWMGEIYATLARWILGLNYRDFSCGFKLFARAPARDIFSRLIINGWIFDTEALFLAKKLNYPVVEVGVNWAHDSATKVKVWGSIFSSIMDLVKIVRTNYDKQ